MRLARPLDVIRVDGRLHAVVSVEMPGQVVSTEPLSDVLAHSICVGPRWMSLGDLLLEDGWIPPWAEAREDRSIRLYDSTGKMVHEIGPHFATPGGTSVFPTETIRRIEIVPAERLEERS